MDPGEGQGSGVAVAEGSKEENKKLEGAPAECELFENVSSRVPAGKNVEEVKKNCQGVVHEVELIESPLPNYEEKEKKNDEQESGVGGKKKKGQQRRPSVPWTEEEHRLFLMGLNRYGKGDWRSISRYYVISKTPTQVASHAQKYFRRKANSTPVERRRPSIHDIRTVDFARTAAINMMSPGGARPLHNNLLFQAPPPPPPPIPVPQLIMNPAPPFPVIPQKSGFLHSVTNPMFLNSAACAGQNPPTFPDPVFGGGAPENGTSQEQEEAWGW